MAEGDQRGPISRSTDCLAPARQSGPRLTRSRCQIKTSKRRQDAREDRTMFLEIAQVDIGPASKRNSKALAPPRPRQFQARAKGR